MPNFWCENTLKVKSLPDKLEFDLSEQTQIKGKRIYVKSKDENYNLIRDLSLPNITYIKIQKILDEDNNIIFYFKLYIDYFNKKNFKHKKNKRKGHSKYRKTLLELCPICPITNTVEPDLLIASHIKPWAKCNPKEKIDPYNGFMFTPTYDFLFDKGYISFTNDKKIILSKKISKDTYDKLGIYENLLIPNLHIEGRESYLKYHRENILKK